MSTHTIKIKENRVVEHKIQIPYYAKYDNNWFFKLDKDKAGKIQVYRIIFTNPAEFGWSTEEFLLDKGNVPCTKEDWDAAKERFIKYMETI